MTLSGIVSQLEHPPAPLFVPVKAAVTYPAEPNRLLPGEGVEGAKAVDSIQKPFSKAAKGRESKIQYYNLKIDRGFWVEDCFISDQKKSKIGMFLSGVSIYA